MGKPKLQIVSIVISLMLILTTATPVFADDEGLVSKQPTSSASLVAQFMDNPSQRMLVGNLSPALNSDQDVLSFISNSGSTYGLKSSDQQQFALLKKNRSDDGATHYLFQQTYQGIPVYGKYMSVHLDQQNKIHAIGNKTASPLDGLKVPTQPGISSQEAIDALKGALEQELGIQIDLGAKIGTYAAQAPTAELLIYPYQGLTHLVYQVKLSYISPTVGNWTGFVDAISGKVIDKFSNIDRIDEILNDVNNVPAVNIGLRGDSKMINTYYSVTDDVYSLIDVTKDPDPMTGISSHSLIITNEMDNTLGKVWGIFNLAQSKDPTKFDMASVDAHYYAGVVYDYYDEKFDRKSIDDNNMNINSFVHVREFDPFGNLVPMDNAYWSANAMFYGDGSGSANGGMKCLACALDVVAHEMTHGLIQYSTDLEYRDQPGALNESFADIIGQLIEFDSNPAKMDWTIGEDLGLSEPLRDMTKPKNINVDYVNPAPYLPNEEPNPYYDHGGVHENSGIPNHAAYLMADGIDNLNFVEFDGKDFLAQTTYDVLTKNYLTPASDFQDARNGYLLAAEDYAKEKGLDAAKTDAVKAVVDSAWTTVGLPANATVFRNIKSFDPQITPSSERAPIINDNLGELYFFVPYGTDVSALKPKVEVSANATYDTVPPGEPVDFHNALIHDGNSTLLPVTYTVTAGGIPRDWEVYAVEEPIIKYSAKKFTESSANDGSIAGSILITLENDKFPALDGATYGDDLIATGQVFIPNAPAGLTPHLIVQEGRQQAILNFSGKAKSHSSNNSVNNINIIFMENAFTDFWQYEVTNAEVNDIQIQFNDPAPIVPPIVIGGGGGFFGGGGGGFFMPTNDPEDQPVTELDGKIVIEPSLEDATAVNTPDGRTVSNIPLSGETLDEAFELLSKQESGQSQITVDLSAFKGNSVNVQLPAAAITGAAEATPKAVITVETDGQSFDLPVDLLDIDALAKQLGVKVKDLKLNVSIQLVTQSTANLIQNTASAENYTLLTPPVEFKLTAEAGGQQLEINNFGTRYVTKTITIAFQETTGQLAAVVVDPQTGAVSFVPAEFRTVDGKTQVIIHVPHNSIYTVVKSDKTFEDIDGHWAKQDIELLASKQLVRGVTDRLFAPKANVTRAEFVAMVVRALGLAEDNSVSIFSDVNQGAWYNGAVNAAARAKIAGGFNDGTFKPNQTITREEIAVILSKAVRVAGKTIASTPESHDKTIIGFTDKGKISHWAKSSVAEIYSAGIILGKTSSTYEPGTKATRAEAVSMLKRFLKYVNFM